MDNGLEQTVPSRRSTDGYQALERSPVLRPPGRTNQNTAKPGIVVHTWNGKTEEAEARSQVYIVLG